VNDRAEHPRKPFAERLVRQALERQNSGKHRRWQRLPASKGEIPKLLCLDLNKWVDLAKANYGRPGGAAFTDALNAVRDAVARGTLVVPLTAANIDEAVEPADVGRRERLARFMVDLSGNQSLVHHLVVLRHELRHAVARHFVKTGAQKSLRPGLMRPGLFGATMGKYPVIETGNPNLDRLVLDAMYDPEVSVSAMMEAIDRPTIHRFRAKEQQAASIVEGIRKIDAHLSVDERRRLELRNLLRDGSTAEMLAEVLLEMGVERSAFQIWLDDAENLKTFTDDVPGIDVMATLMLKRDLNPEHRTHQNDGKDFSFLKVAIPYANIVVAEKSWSHFAVASGLTRRYGTTVEADAKKLPAILRAAGCL
jgi:hypothetical protein